MPVSHIEDPRTGCWTPAEGHTAESVYELVRGLPHGAVLVELCPTDGCANPGHLRPTFHVTVEDIAAAFDVPAELLTPAEVSSEPALQAPAVVESTPEPTPAPQPPVKRGPGRPRKNPR